MARKRSNSRNILVLVLATVVIILTLALINTKRELNELRVKYLPVTEKEAIPTEAPSTGKLAIIIDDFGYRDDSVSEGFLKLNTNLTVSIIPGHSFSQSFAEKAAAAGCEVIVHMPMESHTPAPGEDEYMLNTAMTSSELERRVEKVYSDIPQASGMNNHQGSKATEDQRVMSVLGSTLKRLGKYFIDSRTTKNTVAETMMKKLEVATTRRHVFLDNEFDPALINEQLDQLTQLARMNGVAIGIGHAKPATLSVLQKRIPELQNEGYDFVFASEVVE